MSAPASTVFYCENTQLLVDPAGKGNPADFKCRGAGPTASMTTPSKTPSPAVDGISSIGFSAPVNRRLYELLKVTPYVAEEHPFGWVLIIFIISVCLLVLMFFLGFLSGERSLRRKQQEVTKKMSQESRSREE